jgi:hypothetical protein
MSTRHQYPDISDILAKKARGRQERAQLSFGEKLEILDKLREQVAPIVRTRQVRRALEENAKRAVRTSS